MKKRKPIAAVISVIMAAVLASGSATNLQNSTLVEAVQVNTSQTAVQSVSNTAKSGTASSTETTSSAIEINDSTFQQYENDDDTFYEPQEESISVLEDSTPYINDAVTVFFDDNATQKDKERIVDSLDGEIVGQVDFMNEYEIKIERSDFEEINALCEDLMNDDSVEFASLSIAEQVESNYVPDDPWDNNAYWSESALTDFGYSFANWWIKATDLDKAWDYDEYFSYINVGMVDAGVDPNHEDLQGRITFPNSFFEKNNAPSYHGNHVAGVIIATQDNQKGLSGVVRNGKLICVDWESDKNQGQKWNNEARILTGFVNAVRAGAKVINFSIGSSGTISNGIDRLQAVKDVVAKLTSYYIAKMLQRGYDFVCCQSAGNGVNKGDISYAVDASNNGLFSPITTDNAVKFVNGVTPQEIVDRIIIVASAQFDGNNIYEQSSFSNGGSQVSICAPGGSIYSAYYNSELEDNTSSYTYLSGTSMATPIVTGIASLVWSVNPSFTGAQVKQFVCDPANTKYEVADSSAETHLPTGTMRLVNAQLAVEAAIRESESYGTLSGHLEWAKITPNKFINFTLTSVENGTVYRLMTDSNGDFSAKLPDGEYTLNLSGKKKNVTVTSEEETDIGTFKSILVSIDFDAYNFVVQDGMQEILSKLQLY